MVTLRRFRPTDTRAVFEACQDPEIPRFTMVPSPYDEDDAREFVEGAAAGMRAELSLAIVEADDDHKLLGSIGIRLPAERVGDVGYWLAPWGRGRGAATRALRLLCAWAFAEFDLARIQLHTLPDNTASQRVAERAGFTREGVLRSWTEMKARRVDVVMFSLLPGELASK